MDQYISQKHSIKKKHLFGDQETVFTLMSIYKKKSPWLSLTFLNFPWLSLTFFDFPWLLWLPWWCPWMMLWLVVVAQCPRMFLCVTSNLRNHFIVQGILVDSQGYQITRQVITLRLHQGAMQTEDTVKGLDWLIPLPKIEAMVMKELKGHIEHASGNVQEICTM